jgi:putative transcriptional regulator
VPDRRSAAQPTAGSLLVALPTLEDPNFHRTVILVLAFSAVEGALGVVLNRPNWVPVRALLPGWDDLALAPDSVFVGGPVSAESVICLAELRADTDTDTDTAAAADTLQPATGADGWAPIVGGPPGLATVDLHRRPEELAPVVRGVRIFSGYAGWSAGQLESELGTGSWLVLPAEPDDAFTPDPDGLWTRVLRRQGGHVAVYATAPPKLSMN